MKRNKVSVKVVPDVRRSKNNKRFPLKLRITYKGKCKFYAIGHDASDEEWMIINSPESKGKLRKIRSAIVEIEDNAEKCCTAIVPFSFKQFEYDFFDQKIQFETVESAFMAYITQLRGNNQVGSAHAYSTAMNALKKYKANLKFPDITPDFLQDFENSMVNRGKAITTVGIYLRQLRAIINIAKEKGIIRLQDYPFGRRKYIIPGGNNMKKALNISQIKQIFEYQASTVTGMDKARDFWILSYLCNGIDMMDLVQLQWRM